MSYLLPSSLLDAVQTFTHAITIGAFNGSLSYSCLNFILPKMHSLARQSARLASRRVLSAPLRSVVLNPVHMRSDRRVVPASHNLYFSTKAKEVVVEEDDLENIVVPTAQSGVEHKSIEAHPEGVLVRDFVRESLYSEVGYFNSSRVINSPGVINFAQLVGRSDYTKRLQDLYYSGVQGWTTPVEIFQPYYAQGMSASSTQRYSLD